MRLLSMCFVSWSKFYGPLLALSCCISCQQAIDQERDALKRIRLQAVHYLLDQQALDGGWHSHTHGILRGGQAYTPYLVDVLLPLQDSIPMIVGSVEHAFQFMQLCLDDNGVLGRFNPQLAEYPVYATALAYKNWPANSGKVPSLTFLLHQQFAEQRGIQPDHKAYGAWGFGEAKLPYGEVGHLDLSHTRRVLEALRTRNLSDSSRVWQRAAHFLGRLQQADGGFCASTYTLGANKADAADEYCVSYATATADGVLALLSLPSPPDASVQAAKEWLLTHEDWAAPSGIEPGQPGDWDKVLYYYHLSVRAQAYAALQLAGPWRTKVLAELQGRQLENGSFSNPWGAPNKEDDPLLATALVVKAINAALE